MKKTIALMMSALMLLAALVSCATPGKTVTAPETPSEVTPTPVTPTPTPSPVTPTPTPTPVEPADPAVELKDKIALFCGDSICMASTHDKKHQWWGWAGRINETYALKGYKNAGVDGASVSNCRGGNTIISQITANLKYYDSSAGKRVDYDFVVLHGGVNDAWDVTPVGEMLEKPASECKAADFDLTTFSGGLENLLYYATHYYQNSIVCYVINFKMTLNQGKLTDMGEYVEATRKICDKWGVPYLDLYENPEFYKVFKYNRSGNVLADGCHPNSKGYDIIYPFIAQFMADLSAEQQRNAK